MWRSRSSNKEPQLISPVWSPKAEEIVETLNHSGLNPEHTLLVGSAALVLYGANLSSDELHPETPRFGDVDLSTTANHAKEIFDSRLDSDSPLVIKTGNQNNMTRTVIRMDAKPLPIDIITAPLSLSGDERALAKHDKRIHDRIQSSPKIAGMDFRIASLDDIIKLKKLDAAANDPKAQLDLHSAYDAMARINNRR